VEKDSFWIKTGGYSLCHNHKNKKKERPQVQMGKYSDYGTFFKKNMYFFEIS